MKNQRNFREKSHLSILFFVIQGQDHGCEGLVDKIKLPRIPRKKWTGTTPGTTILYTEKAIIYIDPNCHRNLADVRFFLFIRVFFFVY